MRKVVYHRLAPNEARSLVNYYGEISPELADAFWAELIGTIENARQFPECHHFDTTGLRRANLRRFPVHFLFRVFESHIRITTIRHDRQHPGYGASRR